MAKRQEPLPLMLVRQIAQQMPGVWDQCDHFVTKRDELRATGAYWDDLVCLPIQATLCLDKPAKIPVPNRVFPGYLQALYTWRYYKEIYEFDTDFMLLLCEQADDDTKIPVDILLKMPFPSYFVKAPICRDYEGFFVCYDSFIQNDEPHLELRLTFVSAVGKEPFVLWLELQPDSTIQESLAASLTTDAKWFFTAKKEPAALNKLYSDVHSPSEISPSLPYLTHGIEILKMALQLILYICCDNADSAENPEQQKITRKPNPGSSPTDRVRETRKWDVGWRYGSQLRQSRSPSTSANPGNQGRTVRPHMRRGHYHHYWVGTKDNKKLILKWIHPMAVGFRDGEDDAPATIHKT